jgi:hypothetical protein
MLIGIATGRTRSAVSGALMTSLVTRLCPADLMKPADRIQ